MYLTAWLTRFTIPGFITFSKLFRSTTGRYDSVLAVIILGRFSKRNREVLTGMLGAVAQFVACIKEALEGFCEVLRHAT